MAGFGGAAQKRPQQGDMQQQSGRSAAPQPDQDILTQGQEAATPEEQAMLEAFASRGGDVIYGEPGEVDPQIAKNLRGEFDPQALSMFAAAEPPLTDSPQDSVSATAVIVTLLAEAQMPDTPDEIVMHGGKEFYQVLVETSEAMGLHDFSDDELEGGWYRAVDLYRVASPRVDPEALSQQFASLMQANEQNRLGEVLPGLPGGKAMERG